MITTEKLQIYERFGGDPDCFDRSGSAQDKRTLSDRDWAVIHDLCWRVAMEKAQLVADSFRVETAELLAREVDSPATIEYLERIAK